jgi:hypothetical protein
MPTPTSELLAVAKARRRATAGLSPLHPDLHVDQHRTNEASWWAMQGVDPHQIALILWGIWNEHKRDEATATEVATEVIKKRREAQ